MELYRFAFAFGELACEHSLEILRDVAQYQLMTFDLAIIAELDGDVGESCLVEEATLLVSKFQ